jgi:GGDEF domain-containing protein
VFAATDPATGLANRIGLLDTIEMASYRLARMSEPFAVVITRFAQLDGLTEDEEHLEAVRDLGALLAAGLRNVDRVGRIGSSTFVSVLANIPFEHIDTVVSRTRASLVAMTSAADVAPDTIEARVIALSITDVEAQIDADTVLRHCVELMDDPSSAETHSYRG